MPSKRFKNMTDDEVWARWQERINRIRQELHHVFNTRQKFHLVHKMFEANDALKATGGDVYRWLFYMWARDAIIAVRRELDPDSNTVSLGCLLDEIADRPHVVTRKRFLGPSGKHSEFMLEILNNNFDELRVIKGATADEDFIDPANVRRDREDLDIACRAVRDYANRMVAHRTPIEEIKLTYGELNAAIDALEPVFIKYYAIIDGGGLMGLEPSIQYDWTEPFQIPWVVPQGGSALAQRR